MNKKQKKNKKISLRKYLKIKEDIFSERKDLNIKENILSDINIKDLNEIKNTYNEFYKKIPKSALKDFITFKIIRKKFF